ncbi:MAG: hypothetical protein GY915_05000 [bacterium]|nr:hypothetical protein [bacterium]
MKSEGVKEFWNAEYVVGEKFSIEDFNALLQTTWDNEDCFFPDDIYGKEKDS